MFESIVSTVLNQVLGNYVANLDGSQLKLGIFSGNVVLKNLKLKKEAVDKLNLPIEIFEGHLGSLELKIPWANLKTQPVRVLIGDLYVLAGPRIETEFDSELETKKEQKTKLELLETSELFRSSSSASASGDKNSQLANDTFFDSLVTKIVDNLQIIIKNIHIRFEDSVSNPQTPFALGLTLSNLSAVSTDSDWNEAFIEDYNAPTHKLAKLDSLAVYWTPNSESFLGLDSMTFLEKFQSLIHSSKNEVEMRYLLKPVSGIGKIVMKKRPSEGEAKNMINLEFETLRLKLDDEQYFDVLMLAQTFIMSSRNLQYRRYKPIKIKPVDGPEVWFKYAVTCVLEKIKSRNKTRLWISIMKRRQTRKKYVALFKKKETDGSLLEPQDLAHFGALEEMLSFEDIKFYRSLARLEMKREMVVPFSLKQKKLASAAANSNFISRWWWSGSSGSSADSSLIQEDDIKKFYETIDYDITENISNATLPRDTKLVEFSFDLKSGSISLAQTVPGQLSRKTILSLQFVELIARVVKRPDTVRAEVNLFDFSIIENLVEGSIFPNLVRAKQNKITSLESDTVRTIAGDEADEIARMASRKHDPFITFVMDELSENVNADKSILFHMKPLEIVLNHQAANKVVDFVYGGRVGVALRTLATAAENHITELVNKTRTSLEHALEEHKSLDLSVNIDAPIIFIPFNCEDPSSFLFIADLGRIQVRSRLVTAEEKAEFTRKKRVKLNQTELASLYSLMYDVLNINLTKIKLSYAQSLAQWNSFSAEPEFLPEANRLIEDIDVNLSIATCIVPRALNLAQTKIYGKIPTVKMIFSDEKYKRLMELMAVLVPENGGKDEEKDVLLPTGRKSKIFEIESAASNRHFLNLSPLLSDSSVSTSDTENEEFFDALDDSEASIEKEKEKQKEEEEEEATDLLEYEAVKIDLLLEVEEICVKLIRENVRYKRKKDLLTFVAKKLRVAANVQPFNTVVNVLLEAFFIRDDMNYDFEGLGSDVFILSGLAASSEAATVNSLLKINVNLVDKTHPLFVTNYNEAEIQVLVELAALNFYMNPATLIQTAEFFDTMFESPESEEFSKDYLNVNVRNNKSLKKSTSLGSGEGRLLRADSKKSIKSEGGALLNSKGKELEVIPIPTTNTNDSKKIFISAKLSEFIINLGIGSGHFANIVLSSANAGVCLDRGDISFNGKIVDLVIVHIKRQKQFEFLKIEGGNVLEVAFNTFINNKSLQGIDQMVKLTSGALHFTYDPLFIGDCCEFGAKLMEEAQILEDKKIEREKRIRKARRAIARQGRINFNNIDLSELEPISESVDEAEAVSKLLQFEIDISSPVLEFPHPSDSSFCLSIHLGHIHASNTFVLAEDLSGNPILSLGTRLFDQFINAKLDEMRIELTDRLNGSVVKLLEDVSVNTTVSLIAKAVERDYAVTDVEGSVEIVRLQLGRRELQRLVSLLQSIQQSLNTAMKPLERLPQTQKKLKLQKDEYVVDEHNALPTELEVDFNVGGIELILFEDMGSSPIARFALEGLSTSLIIQKDTSMIFEQYVKSICARDLRQGAQKRFKEIIIPHCKVNEEIEQEQQSAEEEDVKFKYEKTKDGDSFVRAEVNAPQIVLSVDFVKAVLKVFDGIETAGEEPKNKIIEIDADKVGKLSPPLSSVVSLVSEDLSTITVSESDVSVVAEAESKMFILAEIKGMNIFVLEDPESESSEAMQLSIKHVTFAQQTNVSLSVDSISAGFVNMNNLNNSMVQFLDTFDITATVESSKTREEQVTQVWAIIKPIVLRFSYQDIQFFTKLAEQFSGANEKLENENMIDKLENDDVSDGAITASTVPCDSESSVSPPLSLNSLQSTVPFVRKLIEQVQVNLEGIRIMFIDDFAKVHIPFLDIAVDRIAIEVKDWSSDLRVHGILKLHANYFNRLNSHWEPVIEPWSVDLSMMTKKLDGNAMSEILFSSDKVLEIIASNAFVGTLLSVTSKMSVAEPRAASSYREVSKPYLIRNYTGHQISLWAEGVGSEAEIVEIEANTDLPFEFEDWRLSRKGGIKSKSYKISVHLMDSAWETIKSINVDQEGLFVYALRPKLNSISHKLVCEIELKDGIRHVILRSATCMKNMTAFDIEIMDIAAEKFTDTVVIRGNGGLGSLPINFSAGGAFRVRPSGMGYGWSSDKYDLHELFVDLTSKKKKIMKRVRCEIEDGYPFFFDMTSITDTPEEVIYATASLAAKASIKRDGSSKGGSFYGLGTITLSAPLEIENYLPFDIKLSVHDIDSKYDIDVSLTKGAMIPVHAADLRHNIGISVLIDDGRGFRSKQIVMVNSVKGASADSKICLRSESETNEEITLFIEYENNSKFGGKRIKIYSPYVIINQTGQNLELKPSTTGAFGAGKGADTVLTADTPILFSYPESSFVSGKDRIKIRTKTKSMMKTTSTSDLMDGNGWSKLLSLDAIGNVNNFDIFDKSQSSSDGGAMNEHKNDKNWYNYSLYSYLGSERFSKIHIVKVSPRFIVSNRLGRCVYIKSDLNDPLKFDEGNLPLHLNPNSFKSLRISVDNEKWTAKFSIENVVETYFKISDTASLSKNELIKVMSVLETPVMYIVLTKERKWPFKLVNHSSIEVKYGQKQKDTSENDLQILLPGESECFAWDDPSASNLLLTISVMERTRDYNIHDMGPCKPLVYRCPGGNGKGVLGVDLIADGPVIVVKFRDLNSSSSSTTSYRRSTGEDKNIDESSESSDNNNSSEVADDVKSLSFTFKIAGFGISLIGSDLVEFMYLYGKGLEFRLQDSKLYQTIGFKLKWFQIDNNLFEYTHPILMYPAVIRRNEEEMESHPTLNIGIIKSKDTSHGVEYIKYFGLLLQEMNVEMGEELLKRILLYAQFDVKESSLASGNANLLNESDFKYPTCSDESNGHGSMMMYYFELFQIHPIKLNITFSLVEADEAKNAGISAYNPLRPLLSILSMASGNISDAPLKFNSLLLEHPIVSVETLKNRIIGHYTQQAIVQVHKILGSIDMLGNPVGLFNTMGEGVTDLFYEPYQGFVSDRPQDIGIGLAKGGFSFVRKTVSGLTGTFSKLTGSLGKGLAAATMDTSFQRTRRTTQARNRPSNAARGVTAGARSFYEGFASGLAGIVEKPIEGAKSSGVGGFFKGVGVGLLGAVTKPLVGALDLTTSISEGVKNTAEGESEEITQIRWPRVIPYDSIITVYSQREAYGQSVLAACVGLNMCDEKYLAHLEVSEDDCIVFLTTVRVLYTKRRTLGINWQVALGEIVFCRPNFDTVLISLRHGEIRKRLIFCSDPGSQEWFCMKIDEAMAHYNEKHRALE